LKKGEKRGIERQRGREFLTKDYRGDIEFLDQLFTSPYTREA